MYDYLFHVLLSMCAYVCVCLMLREERKEHQIPETGARELWAAMWGWELKLGPLIEQLVLLITEPSPQDSFLRIGGIAGQCSWKAPCVLWETFLFDWPSCSGSGKISIFPLTLIIDIALPGTHATLITNTFFPQTECTSKCVPFLVQIMAPSDLLGIGRLPTDWSDI